MPGTPDLACRWRQTDRQTQSIALPLLHMHARGNNRVCQNQLGKKNGNSQSSGLLLSMKSGAHFALGLFYAWERVNCRYRSYSRKFHFLPTDLLQQIYELEDAKLTVGMGGNFFTVWSLQLWRWRTDRRTNVYLIFYMCNCLCIYIFAVVLLWYFCQYCDSNSHPWL